MTKRVLALQHCWDDPLGYLGEILQEHGIICEVVRIDQSELGAINRPLRSIDGYDAVISLGGPQHAVADDKYPYLAEEKVLIRQAVEQDVPFLGICLGGQLLAHSLGAAVTRHTMTEVGFFEVEVTDEGKADPLFQGLPDHQLVFHWHTDTFALPAGGVRLATSENTTNQAFRVGQRAYGLQYHIELAPGMLDTWIQYPEYRQEIINLLGPNAPDILEDQRRKSYPIYRNHTRIVFENFLKVSDLLS